MSDNRAFGYIYGSPENGHRFFGIKTEKAAAQVRKSYWGWSTTKIGGNILILSLIFLK